MTSVAIALVIALLIAVASLAGILFPWPYAGETRSWAAQAIGQDWINLLVVVPCLVSSGTGSRRTSRRARLIHGGALVYALYSYLIYAFAVHWSRLFPVYCGIIGLSFFALAGFTDRLRREDPRDWYGANTPVGLAGGFQIAVGVLFGALWLLELVPALLKGEPPASLAEVGLVTNPVHILDLSIMLPAMIAGGIALVRRRRAGFYIVPVTLGFGLLMASALEGMFAAMYVRGVAVSPVPVALVTVVLVGTFACSHDCLPA